MNHRFLLASALLLASCATSPVKVSQSREIPPGRQLSGFAAVAERSPNKATVIVIRDAGILGDAAPCKSFLVDGMPVARLVVGRARSVLRYAKLEAPRGFRDTHR
jgi:hypothetical protein